MGVKTSSFSQKMSTISCVMCSAHVRLEWSDALTTCLSLKQLWRGAIFSCLAQVLSEGKVHLLPIYYSRILLSNENEERKTYERNSPPSWLGAWSDLSGLQRNDAGRPTGRRCHAAVFDDPLWQSFQHTLLCAQASRGNPNGQGASCKLDWLCSG